MPRYRLPLELGFLALHIGIVILLFRTIDDRQIAALFAGVLFIELGAVMVAVEWIWGRRFRSFAMWSAVLFLLGAALPIMGMRWLNPELPFTEIEFLGITGPQWHKASSYIYALMFVGVLLEMVLARYPRPGRN